MASPLIGARIVRLPQAWSRMSRRDPTPEELQSGSALLSFYRQAGHSAALEHADKPDLRLLVDGLSVACECVQIPPARIFGFVHTRFKQIEAKTPGARAVQVVWPKEAHIWVKEVIADKGRHLAQYRSASGAAEVNLLIHTPIDMNADVIDPVRPGEMNQIRWAAATSHTEFKNVFFFDPRIGVERIYPPSRPFVEPAYDFSKGYPTSGFVLASAGPFTTTSEGAPEVDCDFGEVETQVLVVPPVDPRFKKHKPHYVQRRHRCTIRAGSTTAEMTLHPIEED